MKDLDFFREGDSFPASCRLHNRKEYDSVWKSGRKYHTAHFLCVVFQRPYGPTRLGLTVSRKIGGAVARNRIKRFLREFFRLAYGRLPYSSDLVLVAKKGAAELSYETVTAELRILTVAQAASSRTCSKN